MRNIAGAMLLFFICSLAFSQQITVLDKYTGKPVFDVVISNEANSIHALTSFDGHADISKFKDGGKLYFSHISHDDKAILKSEIIANKYIVYLMPNENELEQVVLSVAKFKMNKDEVPQKILGLSLENVLFSNPQTSADLLQSSGQVFVQKSQMGGGSPMIRGFSSNRLLITVDGVRMNSAIFRSGNLQNVISVDPLMVANTEVILGPGSVVYGSDAIGGVMNFYTLKPSFAFNGGSKTSANFYTRYATANDEKTVHVDVNIGADNWAFLTGVTYADYGDLRMGSHGPEEYLRNEYVIQQSGTDVVIKNPEPKVQKPTAYNQINLLQKIKFMPNKVWDFNLGLMYSSTSDFPRYDRLYRRRNGELRSAEWYYGPQDWFMGNFNISKKGFGQWYDTVQLTAAYQNFKESRNDRDLYHNKLFHSKEQVDAYSVNLDFEKVFEESKFYYGAEYVFNKVRSAGEVKNLELNQTSATASRYPDDSSWQSLAAYLTYQWKIAPELSFQSGLRYNYILLNADFNNQFYDFPFNEANIETGALTGSVGINWKQNDYIGWRLNLSSAFRSPNIDDVGKIFDSEPGAVVVPNPDLKPEYAYNSELGFDWKALDNLQFEIAGFYTYLDNAMVRRDFYLGGQSNIDFQGESSQVQAIQNASKAWVYGFEAATLLDLSVALRFKTSIAYTRGKEEEDNGRLVNLRHAAPLFGRSSLMWHKQKIKIDLSAEYNGELSNDRLAPSEQGKDYLYAKDADGNPYSPSWYSLDLTGQYAFDKHWTVNASLENITDQRYRTYSSGIAAAGRNLILAIRYKY